MLTCAILLTPSRLLRYDEVATSLVARGLAIQHVSNNLGQLALTIQNVDGSTLCSLATPPPQAPTPAAEPPTLQPGSGGAAAAVAIVVGGVSRPAPTAADRVQIRFPYAVEILELLDAYFGRNVPSELWFGPSAKKWLSSGEDVALRAKLAAAIAALETELLDGLADCLRSGGSSGGSSGVGNKVGLVLANPQQWLWALEDWAMASLLLRDDAAADAAAADGDRGGKRRRSLVLTRQPGAGAGAEAGAAAQPMLMTPSALATLLTSGEESLQLLGGDDLLKQSADAVQITIIL